MIFYHSGCGNSRFVAQSLAEKLGEELVYIPHANLHGRWSYAFRKDESMGFVWPVYAWGPPKLVTTFISKLRLIGKPKYIYFVCTCGDESGYSERIFRKALRKLHLGLDAAFCLQMPETYINLKPMKLDSPEGAKAKIEAAKAELPHIAECIAQRLSCSRMRMGSHSFLKSYIIRPLFYAFLVTDRKFYVTEACTGCGFCTKVCPLKNIGMESGRPKWYGNCTTCNACYHSCPHNAIQFGKATLGKGQYLFPMGKELFPMADKERD